MKNTIKIVSIIIGTIIGAGFASGKEIYVFFAKYGNWGIMGVFISTIFTGAILYKTLRIIEEGNIENYEQFLNQIKLKSNSIINKIVNLFLLVSFLIMISGFFSFVMQEYGKIIAYITTVIFITICYIIFINKTKAVAQANQILVPILIITIFLIGSLNLKDFSTKILVIDNTTNNPYMLIKMVIDAVLYTSYNSIILIPVLTNFRRYIEKTKLISIISCIIILIVAISIFGLLLRGIFYAEELDFPIIEIIKEFGKSFKYIYEIVIILSIFTSAISTGFTLLENIKVKEKNRYKTIALAICLISLITAQIGFANLVQILYPVFGVLGLIQIKTLMQSTQIDKYIKTKIKRGT